MYAQTLHTVIEFMGFVRYNVKMRLFGSSWEVRGLSININDVNHVANLARLELSAEEKERFTAQLNAILQYADKLNELDTSDIEPTSHVLPLANVMREDEVRPSWPVDRVLSEAPETEDGHFKVPAVLE